MVQAFEDNEGKFYRRDDGHGLNNSHLPNNTYRYDSANTNDASGPHFKYCSYLPNFEYSNLPKVDESKLNELVNKSEFYSEFLSIDESELKTPFHDIKNLVDKIYDNLPESLSGYLNDAFNTKYRIFYDCYREILNYQELSMYESDFKNIFHETLNAFMKVLKEENSLLIKNFIVSTCGEVCRQFSDAYNYGLAKPRFDVAREYLDISEEIKNSLYDSNNLDPRSINDNTVHLEILFNKL